MRKTLFILFAIILIVPVNNISSAAVAVASSNIVEPDPAKVKAAVEEFKSLSKREKKHRLKQLKKEIQAFKAARKEGREMDTNTLLLVILAVLLPPLAVYIHQGEFNTKFWITLILWLLGWIVFTFFAWLPLLAAIIYALIVILGNQ
jgi:uncharacterized membrane protein YqaE (UPF0057 family)